MEHKRQHHPIVRLSFTAKIFSDRIIIFTCLPTVFGGGKNGLFTSQFVVEIYWHIVVNVIAVVIRMRATQPDQF